MSRTRIQPEPPERGLPIYMHLEPIVDALIHGGNSFRTGLRWASTRDGYVCYLVKPIDFNLVQKDFELPPTVVLNATLDLIACEKTGAVIYGREAKSYAEAMRSKKSLTRTRER